MISNDLAMSQPQEFEIKGPEVQRFLDYKITAAYEAGRSPFYAYLSQQMYVALLRYFGSISRYGTAPFHDSGHREVTYQHMCGQLIVRPMSHKDLGLDLKYEDVVICDEDNYAELLLEKELFK